MSPLHPRQKRAWRVGKKHSAQRRPASFHSPTGRIGSQLSAFSAGEWRTQRVRGTSGRLNRASNAAARHPCLHTLQTPEDPSETQPCGTSSCSPVDSRGVDPGHQSPSWDTSQHCDNQTEETNHFPNGANGFACMRPSHPHRARALLLSLQLLRNLPDNSLSAVLPPNRPGKSRSR